ncbi:MAG: AAA family ATPase [Planctomycetota bacterium]|nr:AAA family ATPase [Planctomycetota bacterium]
MQTYIPRQLEADLRDSLGTNPVTAVLGPRQAGKSTLVRHCLAGQGNALILDLDLPSDLRRLTDPELFLREHADRLVCIDEIQLKPDLFPLLRALVDMDRRPGRFVILGSASRDLIRQSSETLAGRIHYLEPSATAAFCTRFWSLTRRRICSAIPCSAHPGKAGASNRLSTPCRNGEPVSSVLRPEKRWTSSWNAADGGWPSSSRRRPHRS